MKEQINTFKKGVIKMNLSPLKSIKKYCYECSGNSKKNVRECHITDCPLFPFRQGRNPNRKNIASKPTGTNLKG
jgi:hypothetical protein